MRIALLAVAMLTACAFSASAQVINCQTYGNQQNCRGSNGFVANTQQYGNQAVTRFNDGSVANTQQYGNGFTTRFSGGAVVNGQQINGGQTTVLRLPDGRAVTCQSYGNQQVCR